MASIAVSLRHKTNFVPLVTPDASLIGIRYRINYPLEILYASAIQEELVDTSVPLLVFYTARPTPSWYLRDVFLHY